LWVTTVKLATVEFQFIKTHFKIPEHVRRATLLIFFENATSIIKSIDKNITVNKSKRKLEIVRNYWIFNLGKISAFLLMVHEYCRLLICWHQTIDEDQKLTKVATKIPISYWTIIISIVKKFAMDFKNSWVSKKILSSTIF